MKKLLVTWMPIQSEVKLIAPYPENWEMMSTLEQVNYFRNTCQKSGQAVDYGIKGDIGEVIKKKGYTVEEY